MLSHSVTFSRLNIRPKHLTPQHLPQHLWPHYHSRHQSLSPHLANLFPNTGYVLNPDGSSCSVRGYSELAKNWRNGVWQPVSVAMLQGVMILTETLVHRVLFDISDNKT